MIRLAIAIAKLHILTALAALFALGVAVGRSVAARETACVRACDADAGCVGGCLGVGR